MLGGRQILNLLERECKCMPIFLLWNIKISPSFFLSKIDPPAILNLFLENEL